MQNVTFVKASEIGEYIYCKRAWWQSFKGFSKENEAMRKGTLGHSKLGDYLASFKKQLIIFLFIFIFGLLLAAVSVFLILQKP